METTINKEKFLVLKNDIKSLSQKIKSTKVAHKEAQRKNDSPWVTLGNLQTLKYNVRHKLIAYALMKGKDYGNVEKSVHEGNEPNWNFIKEIQNEYSN